MMKRTTASAAALVLAAAAWAGVSPGYQIVQRCAQQQTAIQVAYGEQAGIIANAAAVRLAALDDAGASDERLTATANAALARIDRLTARQISASSRVLGRCVAQVTRLYEDEFLDDQLDDLYSASANTIDIVRINAETFRTNIGVALATELGD